MVGRTLEQIRQDALSDVTIPQALTIAVVGTLAFDIRLSLFSLEGVRVPVLLFELPLAGLSLAAVWHLVRKRWRPRSLVSWLAALLALMFIVSAVAHPSWFVVIRLYRFAAAASLSFWIFTMIRGPGRQRLYLVAAGVALFQAYLASGQHFLGKGMGYSFLGEADYLYGGGDPPLHTHGTFPLHHIFAGSTMAFLALLMQASWRPLSKLRRWWFPTLAAATLPMGFTYSRMGAVAWLLVVAVLGIASIKRPRPHFAVAVSILIGGLVAGVVGIDGWAARTTETIQGEDAGGDDTGADVGGRISMAIEAIRVVQAQPVLGTGIGRYHPVGTGQQEDEQLIAHNVPLLIAAENGVLAGLIAVMLLGIAGVTVVRAGPLPTAVFIAYLPFLLLDHFPYEDTQGIALTGLWIAAVSTAIVSRSEA